MSKIQLTILNYLGLSYYLVTRDGLQCWILRWTGALSLPLQTKQSEICSTWIKIRYIYLHSHLHLSIKFESSYNRDLSGILTWAPSLPLPVLDLSLDLHWDMTFSNHHLSPIGTVLNFMPDIGGSCQSLGNQVRLRNPSIYKGFSLIS